MSPTHSFFFFNLLRMYQPAWMWSRESGKSERELRGRGVTVWGRETIALTHLETPARVFESSHLLLGLNFPLDKFRLRGL